MKSLGVGVWIRRKQEEDPSPRDCCLHSKPLLLYLVKFTLTNWFLLFIFSLTLLFPIRKYHFNLTNNFINLVHCIYMNFNHSFCSPITQVSYLNHVLMYVNCNSIVLLYCFHVFVFLFFFFVTICKSYFSMGNKA